MSTLWILTKPKTFSVIFKNSASCENWTHVLTKECHSYHVCCGIIRPKKPSSRTGRFAYMTRYPRSNSAHTPTSKYPQNSNENFSINMMENYSTRLFNLSTSIMSINSTWGNSSLRSRNFSRMEAIQFHFSSTTLLNCCELISHFISFYISVNSWSDSM